MKKIKLTQNKIALVDDEDFEYLNQFKWHVRQSGNGYYACTYKNRKAMYMHRMILKGKMIDHIDGNGLNNRKLNLRIANHSLNSVNCRKRKNTTSKYKGVSLHKPSNLWRTQVGKTCIGYFKTEIEAARAYNKTAIQKYGQFVILNKEK